MLQQQPITAMITHPLVFICQSHNIDIKTEMNNLREFGRIARGLARNPLGIIALFIVLVYGMAAFVAVSNALDSIQRTILIIFLVIFPIFVLVAFYMLVSRHAGKLYAPSDFREDRSFLETMQAHREGSPKERAQLSAEQPDVVRDALKGILDPSATDQQVIAMQYVSRWNSPEFKDKQKVLGKYLHDSKFSSDIRLVPLDDQSAIFDVFDFFEELSISVIEGIVDEKIVRAAYGHLIKNSWTRGNIWIKQMREVTDPTALQYFEELAKKWGAK